MKICTLVVRIIGIVLLAQSAMALVEAVNMGRGAIHMGAVTIPSLVPEGALNRMYVYAGIGAAIGLICTLFAARVARWLTFDEHES